MARQSGAFRRIRDIEPLPFLLGLLSALVSGDSLSITSAHRQFEDLAGRRVARSTFDERLAQPATVTWCWTLFSRLLLRGNRAQRRSWPEGLRAFLDVLVDDGTQFPLRKSLHERFASTTPGMAALKLLACVSLRKGQVEDARFSAAIHHDHRVLRQAPVPQALHLRDLGFYDHHEFAAMDDANASFISLLKSNAAPVIERVFRGVESPQDPSGRRIDDRLVWKTAVDLEARFLVSGQASRLFRVVGLRVRRTDRHDKKSKEMTTVWLVTNVSPEIATAEQIGALYRLRYVCIERLFRSLKSLCKVRRLDTGRAPVVFVFVILSLLLQTLSDQLVRALEERWGMGEVSRDGVMKVLLVRFKEMAKGLCRGRKDMGSMWEEWFEQLQAWGEHPNGRQPSRVARILEALA